MVAEPGKLAGIHPWRDGLSSNPLSFASFPGHLRVSRQEGGLYLGDPARQAVAGRKGRFTHQPEPPHARALRSTSLPAHLRKGGPQPQEPGPPMSPDLQEDPPCVSHPPHPPPHGAQTCIHRSSLLCSSEGTVTLHLASLARAITDFRKFSFSSTLERARQKLLRALDSADGGLGQALRGQVAPLQGP